MNAYIEIDGKRAKLTEEQLKALGLEPEKKNPFERGCKEKYFFITGTGNICERYDSTATDDHYSVGNYCTNKELMEQRALHETLNRLLWRYSMEYGGREIDWNNSDDAYRIGYDYTARRWEPYLSRGVRTFGAPYFATIEAAYSAIAEIIKPFVAEHPEFKW